MFKLTTSQAYNVYDGKVGIPINSLRIIALLKTIWGFVKSGERI